jgi:hypothetical protein
METHWVPGVNHLGTHGRWAFTELTQVYSIQADFQDKVEREFGKIIETAHLRWGWWGRKAPWPGNQSGTTRRSRP